MDLHNPQVDDVYLCAFANFILASCPNLEKLLLK